MRTCVIDTGGGFKSIYGAGIFDIFLERGIHFDCCIGVSAGSANISSYAGAQPGRNYIFYHDYAFRREYMSMGNLLRKGEYLHLDYIYRTLSNSDGENPLNIAAILGYDGDIYTVATDAITGEPQYFGKGRYRPDDYGILSASCAIPLVCRAHRVDDRLYYDGGIADPVPLDFALEQGCDRIVLILTHPIDFVRDGKLENRSARIMGKKYPGMERALRQRAERYNDGIRRARELAEQGRCIIIAPDDTCGISTLTRDKAKLDALYQKGRADAVRAMEDGTLRQFLEE